MRFLRLPFQYGQWHYGAAWIDILRVYTNCTWFVWHFFSISLLLKTLFQPFQRIHDTYTTDSDHVVEDFFGTLVVNGAMRVVGACMRLFLIALGAVVLAVELLLGLAVCALWPVLPVLCGALLFVGGALLVI